MGSRWAQVCALLRCVQLQWKSQESSNTWGILSPIPRENCFKIHLCPSSLQCKVEQRGELLGELLLWKEKIGSSNSSCFFWWINRCCMEWKVGFEGISPIRTVCAAPVKQKLILQLMKWARGYPRVEHPKEFPFLSKGGDSAWDIWEYKWHFLSTQTINSRVQPSPWHRAIKMMLPPLGNTGNL